VLEVPACIRLAYAKGRVIVSKRQNCGHFCSQVATCAVGSMTRDPGVATEAVPVSSRADADIVDRDRQMPAEIAELDLALARREHA
jgi:hypothetical protein